MKAIRSAADATANAAAPESPLTAQGEMVYKHQQLSQGVYFVVKGAAEAFVRTASKDRVGRETGAEERVNDIIFVGEIFGYTK